MTTTLGAITPGEEPKRVTITEQATKSGRSLRAAGWLYEENRRLLQERDELVGALREWVEPSCMCYHKDAHGAICKRTSALLSKHPKP